MAAKVIARSKRGAKKTRRAATREDRPRPELVIITGLSGSGKSYVQSTLEDVGFYCCDNLPIHLIEAFLEEVSSHQNATRIGIVVDVPPSERVG